MKHRGCGGQVEPDLKSEPYHYDSNKGTCNEDDPEIPVYRCVKCGREILGDAQLELDEFFT
jgi:hypothetical protein